MNVNQKIHQKYPRQANNFYGTLDLRPVPILLEVAKNIGFPIHNGVFEPSAGQGHLSRQFRARRHHVYTSDLIDYGCEHLDQISDFMAIKTMPHDTQAIVTNPPYENTLLEGHAFIDRYIDHALSLAFQVNGQVAMLVSHAYCAAMGTFRRQFFEIPGFVCRIHLPRLYFQPTAPPPIGQSPAVDHIWLFWDFSRPLDAQPLPDQYGLSPYPARRKLCPGDEFTGLIKSYMKNKDLKPDHTFHLKEFSIPDAHKPPQLALDL